MCIVFSLNVIVRKLFISADAKRPTTNGIDCIKAYYGCGSNNS